MPQRYQLQQGVWDSEDSIQFVKGTSEQIGNGDTKEPKTVHIQIREVTF